MDRKWLLIMMFIADTDKIFTDETFKQKILTVKFFYNAFSILKILIY
jgi:hypothetical protein